ncbi:MAG: glycosyltransferase [Pseudomonadota bacterium]|nr:glycosyltransferase [Pseudomonadota bacterium]
MSPFHFSVVIPAYNAAKTLRSTVVSVLLQTDQDFEIVIVDDGSTDETLKVMLDLAGMDWRIRIVSTPNSGVSATRNFGAKMANGRFLAFLDADDQWHPEKLAQHRALHTLSPTLTASFGQVEFAADIGEVLESSRTRSKVPAGHLDIRDVVIENPACTTSNFVIDREFFAKIGGFDETLRYAEDQELLARVISDGGLIRGIDNPLVRYRMSEDGLSCDFEAMLEGWRSFASLWISGQELARAEAIYCRYLTRRALRAGATMEVARSYALRGLNADRAGFMEAGARSYLTLGGVIAGGVMPASVRRAVFA